MDDPLIEIEDLTIQYSTDRGPITAVSNASLTVEEGEYIGLVGESGCGKSTLAKSLIGALDSNGRVSSGTIRYKGEELQDLSEEELNERIRWKEISWIPQGSMNSLDPLESISDQAVEIGKTHTDLTEEEILDKFRRMFEVVGLQRSRISDYPHQFSGGMKQRAIIALALFLEPSVIIADEPTTALDVIMQDQILKYLDEVKDAADTSMLMITHDISLVFETCDRMAIMHSGQIAETGSVTSIYDAPRHPYSIMLQDAFPDVRYPDEELRIIEGHPPENIGETDYCTYVDRCPWAVEECGQQQPPLEPVGDSTDQKASCFRKDEVLDLYRSEREDGEEVTRRE